MLNPIKAHPTTKLTTTLPDRIFTRGGSSIDPTEEVWEWTDGPFKARLDFRRYNLDFRTFITPLKQSLAPFLRGHSSSHVSNLFQAFSHLTQTLGVPPNNSISAKYISDYAAKLKSNEIGRLGTLNGLLQRWTSLELPGVEPECAIFLLERRKPGNKKGDAVRNRDPVSGPLNEDEYTSLYSATNAAYGRGDVPLWALLLMRLLLACGGRISQYASLKVIDFDSKSSVLSLPQGKTGEQHARTSFLQFDIGPQTARLITEHIESLRTKGNSANSALFPRNLISLRQKEEHFRTKDNQFFGHCFPPELSFRFREIMEDIAPPTARLDFAPLPIAPKRFRYTFGTRLAEEGASKLLIANRLGHADLQNVEMYVAASPRVVENIDQAMGAMLAPLARAFMGNVVSNELESTQKGSLGSRIIDFRVSTEPLGSCEGKGAGCTFNKPVACYTCFRFEPWLDAPHEKVLHRLQSERDKWTLDDRMAAVNDEPIRAVKEVIWLCIQASQQHSEKNTEDEK